MRTQQLDFETAKACLEDIGNRFRLGQLNEAEADAARLALLSQAQAPRWEFRRYLQGGWQPAMVVAGVFVLVAGVGAVTSYSEYAPKVTGTTAIAAADDDDLARLKDFATAVDNEGTARTTTAAGRTLPDVSTMIDRLATRLEKNPQDGEGWRTLGWSYFQMERYEQAAAAFSKAVELNPASDELKRSYEAAKAKVSEGTKTAGSASGLQPETASNGGGGLDVAAAEAMPPPEHGNAIRSMVDGLAARLESSPNDVEGWTSLMRSRVVLGESEAAATAFRKARDVFKDDPAASGRITAAAIELGVKTE